MNKKSKKFKKLSKFYLMVSVDKFGWKLISIYIPIYLKVIGYSWEEVFIYFIIQNTFILFSFFLAYCLGSKIGIRNILFLRMPFLGIFLYFLFLIKDYGNLLYSLAILDGIQSGFFWFSSHIFFSQSIINENTKREVSKFFAIPRIFSLFAPLIGIIIIVFFDFSSLFLVGSFFLILAVLPIISSDFYLKRYKLDFRKGLLLYKKYPNFFYAEIFNNIAEEIEGVIWPIFIYIFVLNVVPLGYVNFLWSFGIIVFTFWLGKIKIKNNRRMIQISAFLIMIVWLLRFYASNETVFYLLTVFSSFSFSIFSVFYYSIFYNISKKEEGPEFFTFREIPVWIARMIVFVLAIFFVDHLEYLFLLAALTYLYFLWKRNLKLKGMK